MTIIVEDGTVVTGANSYSTRADYITYAASLGVAIADDADADVELIKAANYIGDHEDNLKGCKTTRDQPIAYPRSGLVIEGWSWSNDEVPRQVILCQYAFAIDVNAGIDLWNQPVNPNLATKSERVEGAIDIEYAIEKTNQKLSRTSTGAALLSSLLQNNGLFSIPLVRA